MKPSSAMTLVWAGLMSAALALNVSASPRASDVAMKFSLHVVFIVLSLRSLFGVVISLRLPQLRRGPLAFRRFLFRPVEAHVHDERPFWGGEPVGFLVFAGGFVLDDQRQPAVGIALELRQHGRVDQVTIDGVGHQQTRG